MVGEASVEEMEQVGRAAWREFGGVCGEGRCGIDGGNLRRWWTGWYKHASHLSRINTTVIISLTLTSILHRTHILFSFVEITVLSFAHVQFGAFL
jgi:hypothetical protein